MTYRHTIEKIRKTAQRSMTAACQRDNLLEYLSDYMVHTKKEIRDDLGIEGVAARVSELRIAGYQIDGGGILGTGLDGTQQYCLRSKQRTAKKRKLVGVTINKEAYKPVTVRVHRQSTGELQFSTQSIAELEAMLHTTFSAWFDKHKTEVMNSQDREYLNICKQGQLGLEVKPLEQ